MALKVEHFPQFNVERVTKVYSDKDGVPVKYVCTTELRSYGSPLDIYYRETPHPEFGNRYFGIGYYHYTDPALESYIGIYDADKVEELTFTCIPNSEGVYTYSQHTHDCRRWGGVMIDGGRSYSRFVGDIHMMGKSIDFVVRDGEFINVQ